MANKKISELPYINGSKISGNTLVPLVTYFSAATGDTVHTYVSDLQVYLTSGLTGNTVVGNYLPLSGGTVSGGTKFTAGLTANTISATTYQNLPTDVRVTGGTYTAGTITFKNNTGGTFNVTGLTTGSTSTASGYYLPLSGGTVSGTTIFLDPTGTFTSIDSGNRILYDSTNSGSIDWENRVIYDSFGTEVFDWENGILTGQTNIESSTISATTYQNLPPTTFSGGTVTGPTIFTNGLSATTISATTYQNLPTDIRVTGSTYSNNTFTYTNNTGGTFNVLFNTVTGLTVNGGLTVTGNTSLQGLTASTISATTYQNLPDNVTGFYLPLSGGTVSGNTNITANLTVSGNSGVNWFSSNTSSDLVRITQTGSGNAFVVEDSTRPDSSPFVITSGGSVTIGVTEPFTTAGNDPSQLTISKGASGVAFSGLPTSTSLLIQSDTGQSIGMLVPDTSNSQIYFGTPGDVFGAFLRWDFPNRNFILSTANTTGKLIFQTGTNNEVARIDQSGNMGIGLTGATQKLEVSGNTRIYGGISAQTATISGSGQNILTVIGSGNSTTSPLFTVQGSSGELFSINDSLVGSLFSVNDISGLPVVEVFSDNTTLWGSYQAPSLNTTTKVSLTAGTNTIYSIPTSAYTGAFYEYTLISTGTTGARAGQIMSIWSGTSANFNETQTTDIGTTTGVTFTVAVSGSNAVLSSSATTAGWTVKTIIRSI